MPWRPRPIVTLQDRTNTIAMTTGSAAAAATADLNVRAGGNASLDYFAMFELLVRWGTITGVLAGVVAAELYLVPLLDGSNLPDVDLTAGTSFLSPSHRVGAFVVPKQAVTATDMRMTLGPVFLFPVLHRAYLLNRSTQTMTTTSGTSWQLRAVTAQQ